NQIVPAERGKAGRGRPVRPFRGYVPRHDCAVIGRARRGARGGYPPEGRKLLQAAREPPVEELGRDQLEAAAVEDASALDRRSARLAVLIRHCIQLSYPRGHPARRTS